ncbi:CDP-glycerol glycerophosphotransferase family protein [Marinicrinis sediminis]|uniref:CDP-glycerol glycerophosphotransferase family protein n=1 Tax=Marinicrinis sediminis TaxID=1652465 RepID=A0ABW5R691_9BACL
MNMAQYRAFQLTSTFFTLFDHVRYKQVPLLRALAYEFHRKAVLYYEPMKPARLTAQHVHKLYDMLVAQDRVLPVPYHPKPGTSEKIVFGSLANYGFQLPAHKFILCLDGSQRRKSPCYVPEAMAPLNTRSFPFLVRQIKAVLRRKNMHPFFRKRWVFPWLKARLPSLMRKVDGIERLMNLTYVRGIIQSSSVNPVGYLLVHMGKQRKIPTINIQYGLIDFYQTLSTNADYYFAWGHTHKNRLMHYGTPASKIQLMGNARFDPIFTQTWMDKTQLASRLKFPANKTVFFYPEQPDLPEHNKIVVNKIIKALLPYSKHVILLVKKHPNQKQSGLTLALRRKYPFAKLIPHGAIHLYDLIHGSNALLIQYSTVGLEGMLFQKPVIALTFFPNRKRKEYSYYSSSPAITSARGQSQLNAIIRQYLKSQRYRNQMMNRQNLYREQAYSGTLSSTRIRNFVEAVSGMKINRTVAILPAFAESALYTRTLGGFPFLLHSIHAAKSSRWIDEVLVITQDPRVHDIARLANVTAIMTSPMDPYPYAAPMLQTCLHTLRSLKRTDQPPFENMIILDPLYPLLQARQLDHALRAFSSRLADSMMAIAPASRLPSPHQFSTADYPTLHWTIEGTKHSPTGALFMLKTVMAEQKQALIGHRTLPHIIAPEEGNRPIVTEKDCAYAEDILQGRRRAILLQVRKRRAIMVWRQKRRKAHQLQKRRAILRRRSLLQRTLQLRKKNASSLSLIRHNSLGKSVFDPFFRDDRNQSEQQSDHVFKRGLQNLLVREGGKDNGQLHL